jgi:sulfur-oxidizing protein SoxY
VNNSRRSFLKTLLRTSTLAFIPASWLVTARAWADWPKQFFLAGPYEQTIKTLFADKEIVDTDKISLKLPRVAENGAIVPLSIRSKLTNIKNISILVEKNPVPLSAQFHLSPLADPELSLRLKMAKSCDVIVIAEDSEGQLYRAKKAVKVTIGGCGD